MKFDVCIKGDYFNSYDDELVRSEVETKQIPYVGEILCLESSDGGGSFDKFLVMEVFRTFYEEGESAIVYVIPM